MPVGGWREGSPAEGKQGLPQSQNPSVCCSRSELGASIHTGGAAVFNAAQDIWRTGRHFHNSCPKHTIEVSAGLQLWRIGSMKAQCHKVMIVQSVRCQHGLRFSMPAFTCRMLDDRHFFLTYFSIYCLHKHGMQGSKPVISTGCCFRIMQWNSEKHQVG